MGFPKPWPTEWPDPEPSIDPDGEQPSPDPDRVPTEPREPQDLPEFRRRFFSVTWAITHPCNLRCTHCYDVVPEPRRDLDTDAALRLVDRLADAGVRFIAFSGGEPFLRRDLFDVMVRARGHGMQIGARSNGTRITPPVAARLRELDAAVVGVSFDGAGRASHDAVRGEGAFDDAVAGVRALVQHGVRAQMEVVLSRRNVAEALAFIALGESIGVSEVNFSALTPRGRAVRRRDDLLDAALLAGLRDDLRAASRRARVAVTPNCAFLGPCVVNFEPHVTCDGWMTPCYLSTTQLLHVLRTPAEEIAGILHRERAAHIECCGRGAWQAPEPPTGRRALAVVAAGPPV